MCRLVVCNVCKKYTWAGCGSHVAMIMKNVKEENKCHCRDKNKK